MAVLHLMLWTRLQLLVSKWPCCTSCCEPDFSCWCPNGRAAPHVVNQTSVVGVQMAMLYLMLWISLKLLVSKQPCCTSNKPWLYSCRVERGLTLLGDLITGSLIDMSHTRAADWGHVWVTQAWKTHPLLSVFNTLRVLIILGGIPEKLTVETLHCVQSLGQCHFKTWILMYLLTILWGSGKWR
jgi:hypothetical protein